MLTCKTSLANLYATCLHGRSPKLREANNQHHHHVAMKRNELLEVTIQSLLVLSQVGHHLSTCCHLLKQIAQSRNITWCFSSSPKRCYSIAAMSESIPVKHIWSKMTFTWRPSEMLKACFHNHSKPICTQASFTTQGQPFPTAFLC